jgi:hypothetical protein
LVLRLPRLPFPQRVQPMSILPDVRSCRTRSDVRLASAPSSEMRDPTPFAA